MLPLALLRKQSKHVRTLLSPSKLSNHPTNHKKGNSELTIRNMDNVGDANERIHSKCIYADVHSINSDLLPLTILKARLQRTNNSIVQIQTTTDVKIHTMADIYRSFDLPKTANTNIPSIADRNERSQLNIHNPRKWSGLVNVSLKCISTLLQILCPGPSRYELVETITRRLSRVIEDKKRNDVVLLDDNDAKEVDVDETLNGAKYERRVDYESILNKLLHNMFTILKGSKNASIEKRVVRAIVARSLKRGMLSKNCNKFGVPDLSSGKVTR